MTFYDRMKDELDFQDLTVSKMCADLDMPTSTVNSWKNRNSMPPVDTALNIAEYLGTPVEWLVTGKMPKNEESGETFTIGELLFLAMFQNLSEDKQKIVIELLKVLQDGNQVKN